MEVIKKRNLISYQKNFVEESLWGNSLLKKEKIFRPVIIYFTKENEKLRALDFHPVSFQEEAYRLLNKMHV